MLEEYEKAGRIAAEVAAEARRIVKPGTALLGIAERLEMLIVEKGAKPAFPVNISLNDYAAHCTPEAGSEATIGERDVVKIDIGAHVDGYIGDTAFTLDFGGENGALVEASEAALEAAIEAMKPGVSSGSVGAAVEAAVRRRGFKPIENLTGHSLAQYVLHAGIAIPNVASGSAVLREGDFIAVEPFATNGAGRVLESNAAEIFGYVGAAKVRLQAAREILKHVQGEYRQLPFAERWLKQWGGLQLKTALRELLAAGALEAYPMLREAGRGLVAQAEHTVVIERDGARVLTG